MKFDVVLIDRAERHGLKLRFLLFIFIYFFPLFLGGKNKKGKRITKVIILSHIFLLDRSDSKLDLTNLQLYIENYYDLIIKLPVQYTKSFSYPLLDTQYLYKLQTLVCNAKLVIFLQNPLIDSLYISHSLSLFSIIPPSYCLSMDVFVLVSKVLSKFLCKRSKRNKMKCELKVNTIDFQVNLGCIYTT